MFKKEICEQYDLKGWTLVPHWIEEGEPNRFDLSTGEITIFIENDEQEKDPSQPGIKKGNALLIDPKRVIFVDTQVKPTGSEELRNGYIQNGFEIVLFQPKRIVAVKSL